MILFFEESDVVEAWYMVVVGMGIAVVWDVLGPTAVAVEVTVNGVMAGLVETLLVLLVVMLNGPGVVAGVLV